MGGAQPLACTMAGASMLAIECDQSRIEMRIKTRYVDKWTADLDEAMKWINESCAAKNPISVGLLGNAAEILPEMINKGIKPDVVTDQTSAHDPLNGYLPIGWTLEQATQLRESDPERVITEACLLYTSPSPRDQRGSRMPSSA